VGWWGSKSVGPIASMPALRWIPASYLFMFFFFDGFYEYAMLMYTM
jgi:hypothetical protein